MTQQHNPYDQSYLDTDINDPLAFQIAETRKRDYSKYTDDLMEFSTDVRQDDYSQNSNNIRTYSSKNNNQSSSQGVQGNGKQKSTPVRQIDRSQTPDYLGVPSQKANQESALINQSQIKSRSMTQRNQDTQKQQQQKSPLNAINQTTTTDKSMTNLNNQSGFNPSLMTQGQYDNFVNIEGGLALQQNYNPPKSAYTTAESTSHVQNNRLLLVNNHYQTPSYNKNDFIQIDSTMNSNATENLYRFYDAEEGCFRDIRELSDDLCTIDSTTFYDKRAGKKFITLPKHSTILSKFWQMFWNKKDRANNNLIKACREGNLKKISKLLNKYREPEKIADIHFCDKQGYTALHTCAKFNQYDSMNLLLTNGDADINFLTQNEQRQTALHIATIEQHLVLVKSMIQEFQADTNIQDYKLNTALHYAVQSKNRKLVRIIIDGKPDISLRNCDGFQAIQIASTKDILSQKENIKLEQLINGLSPPVTIGNNSTNVRLSGESSYQDESDQHQSTSPLNINSSKLPNNQDSNNYEQLMLQKLKETQDIRNRLKNELNNGNTITQLYQDDLRLSVGQHVTIYDFIPIAKLGQGSYGEVFLVEEINSKSQFAMKMLDKAKVLEQELLRYTVTEKEILQKSNHPFIVKLFYAFQTSKYFFLIQEFCPCGDMAKLLTKQKRFSEDIAKLYIAEILLAIEYLHSKNIIYRDLKPDNIIIDKDGHLKLTDFGLSKENVDTEFHSNSFVGSYAYAAPEIIKHKAHGKSLDWYGLGALLYEFLVGIPPYYDRVQETMFNNIVSGTIKMPMMLSNPAQDLITKLLRRNPLERLGAGDLGAKEIKEHPFFEGINWNDVINKRTYPLFKKRKVVRREQIDLERYIEMIGSTDEEKMEDWSFIRVNEE
eukprot:403367298